MIFKLETTVKKLLADTITPVNIYLKLRDVFAGSVLLESSDYHGNENSLSFICCEPIASFVLDGTQVAITMPNGEEVVRPVSGNVLKELEGFRDAFSFQPGLSKYPYAGLFGYMAYDSVRFFEKVDIKKNADAIPDIAYKLFRFVIVIDHFTNELYLFENRVQGVQYAGYSVDEVEQLIYSNRFATFKFVTVAEERSALTDEQYLQMVKKGIDHCHRGDVFQIVLSRRFTRPFRGDEFNVYRALRSINPSPYLFFFDFGNFKIFGSSPEAQIQIKNGEAHIYPIAGTFKRTGNDAEDAALAEKLAKDEKENAEHVMLVDLARNDLSRSAGQVQVEVFKEVQYYSHVIHLVSKVSGKLEGGARALQVAADTFPAGTLSGAPKPMALSLINQYEPSPRGFYGGCIGFLGFDGSFNHAIMIRTFISKNNELVFQAGAGVVAKSTPESELQEVNNKVAALRKAIELAEQI
ncbi:MAG: anthranilate synthase component I family protein [Bacteroidota bacterium]|jgi:anthranilate synthase component 1|nr:anthranilate synthase component I family protein [Cytophagales bacterium]MCE2957719.1 anthranilate synthase component I family protein [Flammeovirgaceae bacterium]MCZ8071725.1 anthranilate synthase component I family protein [Cytophagales bacterium]